MSVIELNIAEQKLAKFLAAQRHNAARKNNINNAKMGPQSDEETDLEGIAAEIAFCKIMNVYPDLQVGVLEYADAFTTKMGAVDVKTTKYKNGRLLARKSKIGNEPDSYALMIGEFPVYRFVGWIDAKSLIDKQNLIDLGHGEGYALPQERLLT
jgi:hypothetical protein